jgi:competence protein ComFC
MASPLDLLLPPRCALCGAAGPLVCLRCLAGLPVIGEDRCGRCAAPAERPLEACQECRGRRLGFSSARSLLVHEGAARDFVHGLKDGGLPRLAAVAAGLAAVHLPAPAVDLVTWVPAARWRTIRRGYHPPELLSRELGRRLALPAGGLLRSAARRRPQRGLSPSERRGNVRGAFAVSGIPPPAVLLVDDVHTTGATLSECAFALRRAGAVRVEAFALARAVRGR